MISIEDKALNTQSKINVCGLSLLNYTEKAVRQKFSCTYLNSCRDLAWEPELKQHKRPEKECFPYVP